MKENKTIVPKKTSAKKSGPMCPCLCYIYIYIYIYIHAIIYIYLDTAKPRHSAMMQITTCVCAKPCGSILELPAATQLIQLCSACSEWEWHISCSKVLSKHYRKLVRTIQPQPMHVQNPARYMFVQSSKFGFSIGARGQFSWKESLNPLRILRREQMEDTEGPGIVNLWPGKRIRKFLW